MYGYCLPDFFHVRTYRYYNLHIIINAFRFNATAYHFNANTNGFRCDCICFKTRTREIGNSHAVFAAGNTNTLLSFRKIFHTRGCVNKYNMSCTYVMHTLQCDYNIVCVSRFNREQYAPLYAAACVGNHRIIF